MHRFRYDGLDGVAVGGTVELERGEASHLFKTLRAREGFEILLVDGRGRSAKAKVVEGRLLTVVAVEAHPPPARRLHLFIAPPRRQKMDQILRQCAELGVWGIQPVLCERSVSEPDGDSVAGRWEDVLMDACKQSGNPYSPATSAPLRFQAALKLAVEKCPSRFFGAVEGDVSALPPRSPGDVCWFVGPEGGFAPEEEAALRANAFLPLRIGAHILRVETAAVCGAAMLL